MRAPKEAIGLLAMVRYSPRGGGRTVSEDEQQSGERAGTEQAVDAMGETPTEPLKVSAEKETVTLNGASIRRVQAAHRLVKRFTAPTTSSSAERDITADHQNRVTGPPPGERRDASSAHVAEVGHVGDYQFSPPSTRITQLSGRPAVAGTGRTEAYSASKRTALRASIDETIERSKASERAAAGAGRVVVSVDESAEETTWINKEADERPSPRVHRCFIAKRIDDGFAIRRDDGVRFQLPRGRVQGVALAVLVDHPTKGEETLFLDVVTNWGTKTAGPAVLRFDANELPLHKLVAGQEDPVEQLLSLARELASAPECARLPGRAHWPRPPFVRFMSIASLNQALYVTPARSGL